MKNDQVVKPSLQVLSYMLRHKELWPDGFEWAFHDCQRCAMGLAWKLWPKHIAMPTKTEMVRVMGMPFDDAKAIFGGWAFSHRDVEIISPELVADKIDEYLAR